MAKVKYELQLRVISGVDLEKVFLLERSGSTIGRSPDAEIWIHDEHSPRKRCFIDWSNEEECFKLHVWPHTTKMVLNGNLCEDGKSYPIKLGDTIQLSSTTFRVEEIDSQ